MKKNIITVVGVIFVIIIVVATGSYFITLEKQENSFLPYLKYSNEVGEFGLNPPEGWTVREDNNPEPSVIVELPTSLESKEYLYFVVRVYDTLDQLSYSNKEYLDFYVNEYLNYFTNFDDENYTLISHNERSINNMEAYEFIIIYDDLMKEKEILVEKNSRIFQIIYRGPPELYDTYESIFEQSMNTLVII